MSDLRRRRDPWTRRRLLTALAVLGAGGLLAACGQAATAGGAAAPPSATGTVSATTARVTAETSSTGTTATTQLQPAVSSTSVSAKPTTVHWFTRASYQPDMLQPWLAKWTAAQPAINIDPIMVPGGIDPSLAKLDALVASGSPVDVVSAFSGAFLMIEVIQPIDALIARDKYDITRFEPGNFKVLDTYQGKTYMLPQGFGGNGVIMLYNRALFEANDLPAPTADWKTAWSWNTFRDTIHRLTRQEGATISQVGLFNYGSFEETVPMAWGGYWLADDFKTVTCDSAPMIESYTNYLQAVNSDRSTGISTGVNFGSTDAFLAGKAGATTAGAVPLSYSQKLDAAKVEWAFVPFPNGGLPAAVTDMAATNTGLLKAAVAVEPAWTFIKWCIDDGRLAALEERIPNTPALVDAWAKQSWSGRPEVHAEVMGSSLGYARPREPLLLHPAASAVTSIVTAAWNDMRTQKKSVNDALTAAKPTLQSALDTWAREHPTP
jgi:ABC-type glycerol-3-phosphate transport system substrate-binding protein